MAFVFSRASTIGNIFMRSISEGTLQTKRSCNSDSLLANERHLGQQQAIRCITSVAANRLHCMEQELGLPVNEPMHFNADHNLPQ